jgi:hypothetical protein
MPLTTDPEQRFANYDIFSISFPMFDGTKEVTCVVTSEVLQDLAAPDGRHLESTEDLFRDHRSRIEQIASDKYDAGDLTEDEVRVVNSDIKAS